MQSKTTSCLLSFICGALLATPLSAQTGKGMVIFADVVYYNGKVLTVDERFSVTQALAVREGKVMAVGSDREILDLVGPKTLKLDLKGKTVLPGFIDTHSHLFQYAAANWVEDLGRLEPHLNGFKQMPVTVKSVDEAVTVLKKIASEKSAGEVVHVQLLPIVIAEEFGDKISPKEMDEIAPKNPLIVQLRGTDRIVNGLVFKMFTDYFGELPEDIDPAAQGRKPGHMGSGALRILFGEILVKSPQTLAAVYKKELQAWAAQGVTTWSSSLPTAKAMSGFTILDRAGEMPIRFAYSHRMGASGFAQPEEFYKRTGDIQGHGTDYLWMIGVALGSLDSSYPRHCTTVKVSDNIKSRERCEADREYRVMRAAVQAGHRISGTHVYGDGVVDKYLETLEKASLEAGMTLDQIRAKKHNIDHCGMSPRPDQIERGKKTQHHLELRAQIHRRRDRHLARLRGEVRA